MEIPDGPILLHVCCAPCSGPVIERLLRQGSRPTVFFYNPNIYPREEYECRKASVIKYVKKNGLAFIDADYDNDAWFIRVKGLESEPERGRRCSACFDMRLERTALYARENGFKSFATTNGIARWKDLEQVNASGFRAARRYPGLDFIPANWRKNGGAENISRIAVREKFYKQGYCGCLFSLEAAEKKRQAKGFPRIETGKHHYGD